METRPDGVVIVRNPAEGAWAEGKAWTVEEDLRIGIAEGEGPTLFGDIAAVEADSAGRIWVLERQAKELRLFDARGKHRGTIGREGEGPGEFRDPIGLAWAPDGTLWIADPGAGRYTVYDANGIFIDDHPRRVAGYSVPWRGGFGPDGLLYELAVVAPPRGEPRQALLRFDPSVDPLDTLRLPTYPGEQFELRQGSGRIAAGVPFTPFQVMELDPRGFVWTGINDRYRLAQLRPGGDTVRIVEREAAAVPVAAAERDEALAGLKWFTDQGGRVDAGRIPTRKPAYEQVIPDGAGGVWIRPALPAEAAGAAFDVFDAEGRYQGRVRLPGGMDAFPMPVIRGGAIYGVARDSLDVQHVVRARIRRTPSNDSATRS
ncbi:MAG TPA: 6-bladed beta-propeller [Longimicrobium sp.]|nr:6-bladed beta-propeller [Longimicrobium sp.]